MKRMKEFIQMSVSGVSYGRFVFVAVVINAHHGHGSVVVAARRWSQLHNVSLVVHARDRRHIVFRCPIERECRAVRNVRGAHWGRRCGDQIRTQLLVHDVGNFLDVVVRPRGRWIPLINLDR